MLRLNDIKFQFQHLVDAKQPKTRCIVTQEDVIEPLSIGESRLKEGDTYCKETGRKISLTRALSGLNLDKAQRAEIWEQYRLQKPGGRFSLKPQLEEQPQEDV